MFVFYYYHKVYLYLCTCDPQTGAVATTDSGKNGRHIGPENTRNIKDTAQNPKRGTDPVGEELPTQGEMAIYIYIYIYMGKGYILIQRSNCQ